MKDSWYLSSSSQRISGHLELQNPEKTKDEFWNLQLTLLKSATLTCFWTIQLLVFHHKSFRPEDLKRGFAFKTNTYTVRILTNPESDTNIRRQSDGFMQLMRFRLLLNLSLSLCNNTQKQLWLLAINSPPLCFIIHYGHSCDLFFLFIIYGSFYLPGVIYNLNCPCRTSRKQGLQ